MDAMTKHRCEGDSYADTFLGGYAGREADGFTTSLTIRRVVSVRSWAWLGRVAALSLSC